MSAKKILPLIAAGLGLVLLAGCAGTPRWGDWSRYPSRTQIAATLARLDHYSYYPAYEIYFNRTRHQYVYQDRSALWVIKAEPPRDVPVGVLQASPSVTMDFSDNPSWHHAVVVKNYPKSWGNPAGSVASAR